MEILTQQRMLTLPSIIHAKRAKRTNILRHKTLGLEFLDRHLGSLREEQNVPIFKPHCSRRNNLRTLGWGMQRKHSRKSYSLQKASHDREQKRAKSAIQVRVADELMMTD